MHTPREPGAAVEGVAEATASRGSPPVDPVNVLVTGFGPFLDQFPINASWSIASRLPSSLPATGGHPTPVRIHVHPEPVKVAYNAVLDLVPSLFESNARPDIILHIGLAANRSYFAFEQSSSRIGYERNPDVDGKTCPGDRCREQWGDAPTRIRSGFDSDDVWRRWRSDVMDPAVDIRPSDSVGDYLCGFIYYTSLSYFVQSGTMGRPVIFLHVPDLPTKEAISQGREATISLIRALVDSYKKHGAEN